MNPATFNEVLAASLFANLITLWFFYGVWRLGRDQSLASFVIALGACAAVIMIGLSAYH